LARRPGDGANSAGAPLLSSLPAGQPQADALVNLPHVAILTVTTNAAGHLTAYLDALDAISYPEWSLWVVDNASNDGSAGMVLDRLRQATVIENHRNEGFTGACNRALLRLRDLEGVDYVLFLNDDTEVTPGFLEPLVTLARQPYRKRRRLPRGPAGILDDSVAEFDWWRAPGGSVCWATRSVR